MREEKEALSTSLTCFCSHSNELQQESDDACTASCLCRDRPTLCNAAKVISSRFSFDFISVACMRFHTARFSLPAKVRCKEERRQLRAIKCRVAVMLLWL